MIFSRSKKSDASEVLSQEPGNSQNSLHIEYHCHSRSGAPIFQSLDSVETYFGTCFNACSSGKLFSFTIPDPLTLKEEPVSFKFLQVFIVCFYHVDFCYFYVFLY